MNASSNRIPVDRKQTERIVSELLNRHTPVHFQPHGPSMHPVIRDGDVVRVRPATAAELRPGHVVLFHAHDRLELHRLIRRTPAGLLIRGDAAIQSLEVVAPEQILGIAECVRRNAQERRLDHAAARWTGLLRSRLRPLFSRLAAARRRLFPRDPF